MKTLLDITNNVAQKSQSTRKQYLRRMEQGRVCASVARTQVSCSNLAHAIAAAPMRDKQLLQSDAAPNIGIVTSYNDMLSAHQPYEGYPPYIREIALSMGATAQVATSTPAMCDGVTQGQPGMELSLFSRDVIAMSAAIGLSHNVYDGAIYLGICDKIVPGLLIATACFGYLPSIYIPSGPMASGIANKQKNLVRQAYAAGRTSHKKLLESEMASYHSPGTCTFYGTANTNQMLLEMLGLMIPGASFAHPYSHLRDALTTYAIERVIANTKTYRPAWHMLDIPNVINAMVGLLATGGSTNSAMHLLVIANAAGICIDWDDFADLSAITPLLARVYPNGDADVNQFDAAGGINAVIAELCKAKLLHEHIQTVVGSGIEPYTKRPHIHNGTLCWSQSAIPTTHISHDIIRPAHNPHADKGGLCVLKGELGQAIMKTSAVDSSRLQIRAPVMVFESQQACIDAYKNGKCNKDFIAVVRFQGPKANGMPELHKLMPLLGELQDRGYNVALVTDARLSGASGKTPAAIHLAPEAIEGGPIAKLQDGDILQLDATHGTLVLENATQVLARQASTPPSVDHAICGRELFHIFRTQTSNAMLGASVFGNFGLTASANNNRALHTNE